MSIVSGLTHIEPTGQDHQLIIVVGGLYWLQSLKNKSVIVIESCHMLFCLFFPAMEVTLDKSIC